MKILQYYCPTLPVLSIEEVLHCYKVVGKVVARVVQGRLQSVAEKELPELQCGFRRGRACTDMIFTVRQLTEKVIEHRARFLVFVHLKKAYDLVPHEGLWAALEKLEIPEELIGIVRSFYESMKARIRVGGDSGRECKDARWHHHSSICMCLWWQRGGWIELIIDVEGVGTYLLYKYDQKLFRRNTRGASSSTLHECGFANDVALLATTHAEF